MQNEAILVLTLVIIYSAELFFYRVFGKSGLIAFAAAVTLLANIEVAMLVRAFGMEMTLGNILFASTFLATDILSENHSKEDAKKAVNIGIAVMTLFAIISKSWLLYIPSENDTMYSSFQTLFSNSPRIIVASISVYAIVQKLDVFLYHRIWKITETATQNPSAFLWLRNNLATLTSQFLNAFLFNVGAFYGVFDIPTLVSVVLSTFLISVVTSLLDTPFIYLARNLKAKRTIRENL